MAAYIGTMDNSMELFRHLYGTFNLIRNKYSITCFFIAIGFTPPVISRMFDLNCRSLKYQFKKMSIEAGEERVILNDEELDSEVASIVQKFPRIGLSFKFKNLSFYMNYISRLNFYFCTISGHKLLKGLHFNSFGKGPFRARLRASLDRVRVERNIPPPLCAVKRRKYSVKAPLSMVHIDGHHKLIRLYSELTFLIPCEFGEVGFGDPFLNIFFAEFNLICSTIRRIFFFLMLRSSKEVNSK